MTEKYFVATPYTCHKQFLISIKICKKRIMAYGKIQLELKDFEGIMPLRIKGMRIFFGITADSGQAEMTIKVKRSREWA